MNAQVQHLEQGGMNQSLTDRGYPNVRKVPGLGFQSTGGSNYLQFGSDLSFQSIHIGDPETPGNNNNPNFTKYQALSTGGVVRGYPVDTDHFRWDLHGGVGYTFAGLNGKKDGQEDNLANVVGYYVFYGTGVSFGWKNFFVGFDIGRRETRYSGTSTTQKWTVDRFPAEGFYGGVSFIFTTRAHTDDTSSEADSRRTGIPTAESVKKGVGKSVEKKALEKAVESIGGK